MTTIYTPKLTESTIDFLRKPNTGCDWPVPRGRVNLVREDGRWVMRGPSGTHSIADDGNDERLMAHFNTFLWHNLALKGVGL